MNEKKRSAKGRKGKFHANARRIKISEKFQRRFLNQRRRMETTCVKKKKKQGGGGISFEPRSPLKRATGNVLKKQGWKKAQRLI